jgi:uncharacterized protein YjbI with pentapeptide repeats
MINKKQRTKKTINPPNLPRISETVSLPEGYLSDETTYSHLALDSCDLSEQTADLVTFEHAYLKNVRMGSTKLGRVQISDARFEGCELSNAHWRECSLQRIEIIGCRMTGFRASESYMQHTLLKDCKAEVSEFRFAKFKAVRFENCILREADFQNADLRGASFSDCDLRGAQLSGAQLSGTDLRGSQLEGINVPLENLKGAVIDSSQIVELAWNIAKQIGVVVQDNNSESCPFCDDTGRRLVKSERYPRGAIKQCTHEPTIESKLESAS